MTAQQQSSFAIGVWESEPGLTGQKPDAAMLSWLMEPGLLTRRLRKSCGDAFNLQVVNEAQRRAHASDLYRQVALCCGAEPCIFAESRIPLATANAHFWLRDLGKEPLGERLQKRSDIRRGRFAYGLIDSSRLPTKIREYSGKPDAPLWARRSDFYIGDEELTVTEIFLPGVVTCAGHDHP